MMHAYGADGNLLQEASIFKEETLISTLNLAKATHENAIKSLTQGPLQNWWRDGLRQVKLIE